MAANGTGPKFGLAAVAAGLYAAIAFVREQRTEASDRPRSGRAARLARLAPGHFDGATVRARRRKTDSDRPARLGEPSPQADDVQESATEALARGRDAANPAQIPGRGWKDILIRTWTAMGRDHLGLIAAGVAFYGLLAIFPAIGLAVALAGLITSPEDFVGALNSVAQFMPQDAAKILLGQASQVAGASGGGLGIAALSGLVLAFYSSSRGVNSLIEGLNVAYDETEKRSFIKLNLTGFALTLFIILGVILGLTATIVIPAIVALIGVGGTLGGVISLIRWPILVVGTVIGLGILYRYGPSREKARISWLSPGALLACVFWIAGTAGFAWYAGNFASYNQTFGALGGAIVLLMWLWLSAYIVLIGAELNGEIEAQTARDSTTGPELPMGQRGAVKADMLGRSSG